MFEPGLKIKLLGFVSSLGMLCIPVVRKRYLIRSGAAFFAEKKVNFMNIGFNRSACRSHIAKFSLTTISQDYSLARPSRNRQD
jgi:hypothetical protein